MNLYNMYILPIQIYMPKLQLGKDKKQKRGMQEEFYGKTEYIYIYIYIYLYISFEILIIDFQLEQNLNF